MPTPALGGERLPVVVARSVSKSFRVPEEHVHTLKERVLHPRRRTSMRTYGALNDVSFTVQPGEFFGIAGRNGSGKSTLLKCLAGIYQAEGDIWVNGRLSTFIELGVGFNPDLAARDNVVMNGIMLGLTPREARRRVDAVIDFAELQEFKDLKLKNYSSGMHVRLAFSVAIQVDADILMIDEVLAVGDAAFQQKCYDVFNDLRDKGRTIVFVTHDMGALQRFCHRALLLERGDTVYLGEPHDVADRYLELNFGREAASETDDGRMGDGQARIHEVWIENAAGDRLTSVPQSQSVSLRARVQFAVDVDDPAASMHIYNDEHRAIIVANTAIENERSGSFRAGEEVTFTFTFDNVLAPGRYSPVFQLAHRGSGLDVIDRSDESMSFVVTGPGALGGLIDLPVQAGMERSQTASSTPSSAPAGTPVQRPVERVVSVETEIAGPEFTAYSALGKPITGPAAITGDWRRFWHLVVNIAFLEWKLRFFGSALGYLWQLVRPLLLFLVLYVFFTKVAKVGDHKGPSYDDYGAQLLSAIVLFTFFGEATSGSIRSVVTNETLVRKIQFPRMVIPLSVVLVSLFNLGLNLIVVLIFALIAGVTPMWTWLEVPVIVGALVVLCTGIAMLLSGLFVYLRDIEPIWEVFSQVLFYASPIIIPAVAVAKAVSPTILHLYMLNPLAIIFQQFRHAFITHATPSAADLLGSHAALAIPIGLIVVIFFAGLRTFSRIAPRVAEDL